jgi:transposase
LEAAMAKGRKPGLRLAMADRSQIGWDMMCLDDLLAPDDRARAVWDYVESCDLSGLYNQVRAVEGEAGRPPIDPAILMALWLYATLEGVGSARLLERLCERDLAYRWLCGGVGVNYHTLSDFRTEAGAVLDGLLTRSMAALVSAGIVDLNCLAVDGVRVRAAAGTSSFRSASRLKELHELAEQKVVRLAAELHDDPAAATNRKKERDLREGEARKRRIEAAQRAADAIAAERKRDTEQQRRRKPKKDKEPRASTTDGDSRIMRMADGGFSPAYNVQVKTDPKSGCVVGLDVTNKASDRGQLVPAIDEIERRYGTMPKQVLADSGFDGKPDIEALFCRKVDVFCPVPGSEGKPVPPKIQRGEGEGVIAWRKRMSKEENFAIYQQRFACERPHADMRNRGLYQFMVRGLKKVKAVALWYVIAYNFLQIRRLAPQTT